MKKIVSFLLVIISTSAFSQILNPVTWKTQTVKITETEYELQAIANIQPEWHVYSQNAKANGPIPTQFSFKGNSNYLKKGNTKEPAGTVVNDKVFNMEIKYFNTKTIFKQRIKLKTKNSFKIQATVEFMCCNESQCLPPNEVDLEFTVKP